MNTNNTGGISPLKAKKRQAHRGGPKAAKATATSKRRGGFSKSKGKRGAGGRNPGGYNVQTKFIPSVIAPFPGSGGTTTINTSKKPYEYDKDGKLQMTSGVEERTIEPQEAKKGNEFADNCYGAGGERLHGTSYYSEIKGMQIACKWGGTDDGSFSYDKEATPGHDEERTWTQKEGEDKVYTDWKKKEKTKKK